MTVPTGVMVDSLCVLLGGAIGAAAAGKIPSKVKTVLPMSFSLAAMAIGVTGIVKLQSLPAVVVALLLGTLLGTLLGFESLLARCGGWVAGKMIREKDMGEGEWKRYLETFSIAVILFCTGATGIYGSIWSGATGDHSILYAKAALDFLTAIIFATSIGGGVALMAFPMFLAFGCFFLAGAYIVPMTTPRMLADFSGCGGLLMLATGFRMAEIKLFHVADMLPALVLVMPVSWLWQWLSALPV